jgi:hypothetical protein
VEWRGSTQLEWEWLKVEKLNRGGILGPWLDYEAAIMRQDPSKATQIALETVPEHTGGINRGLHIHPNDATHLSKQKRALIGTKTEPSPGTLAVKTVPSTALTTRQTPALTARTRTVRFRDPTNQVSTRLYLRTSPNHRRSHSDDHAACKSPPL